MGPTIDPVENDGYVSPDFELPSDHDSDAESFVPPSKRHKSNKATRHPVSTLEEEEQLALRLLQNRG